MEDFVLNQWDTININYTIPMDLTFKTVYFKFGDNKTFVKKIKCNRQSVTTNGYTLLSDGGISIQFTKNDLEHPGIFLGQFDILYNNGNKITYPPLKYLSVKIRETL